MRPRIFGIATEYGLTCKTEDRWGLDSSVTCSKRLSFEASLARFVALLDEAGVAVERTSLSRYVSMPGMYADSGSMRTARGLYFRMAARSLSTSVRSGRRPASSTSPLRWARWRLFRTRRATTTR